MTEVLPTVVTLVRLVSSVSTNMCLEDTTLTEALPTVVTPVRLVSSVSTNMFLEVIPTIEALPTVVTLVQLVPMVCHCGFLDSLRLSARSAIAKLCLLVNLLLMSLDMILQLA